MVNHCSTPGCTGESISGEEVGFFKFPFDRPDLLKNWVNVCGRQDFVPNPEKTWEGLCSRHFENRLIKIGKGNRFYLKWNLDPVPTLHSKNTESVKSCLAVPKPPRKAPFERVFQKDEWEDFRKQNEIRSLVDIKEIHAPCGYDFKKGEWYVLFYKLEINEESGVPTRVFGSIRVDSELHVKLQCNGNPVPLPEFFRKGTDCRLTSVTMLCELDNYLKSLYENEPFPFLEELNQRKYYQPQGRPPYSSGLIRYAILLHHTSPQAYRLLLERFPLPSISLLKKLQQGSIDIIKSASLLKANGAISEDVVLLGDEMYLQKQVQYHGGKYIGEDEKGCLYKGVFFLMIVGLKESEPFVVKACPETNINGEFVAKEIWEVIGNLANAGFNVRGVVTDNHSSNVSAFNILLRKYSSPSGGSLSWREPHDVFDLDSKLQGHLRKAPKLSYIQGIKGKM